jgi:hypothetical protein
MRCIGIVLFGRSTVFGELPSARSVEPSEKWLVFAASVTSSHCTNLKRLRLEKLQRKEAEYHKNTVYNSDVGALWMCI